MKFLTFLIAFLIFTNIAGSQSLNDIYSKLPDIDNCQPGVLKDTEKEKILKLVNQIRAVHGLNPVTYAEDGDIIAQAGATLCVANGTITHKPTPNMSCYSQEAYDGCNKSNLHIGSSYGYSLSTSESSIIGWMMDNHSLSGLEKVGHRRAIINPFLTEFAFGRADGKDGQWDVTSMAFNYMDYLNGDMNDMDVDFVAYPYHTYKSEWVDKSFYLSFSAFYDFNDWFKNTNVNYASAQIKMTTENGQPVAVSSKAYDTEGWGAIPTSMVWKAAGLQDDVKYLVEITNVIVNGQSKNYSYWFKLSDEAIVEDFKAPDLIYPSNIANNVPKEIDLKWSKIPSAESYDLYIEEKDPITGAITVLIEESGITDTNYTVSLQGATSYFWKVRAVRGAETTDWSDEYTFKTEGIIPGTAKLIYPVNNAKYVDRNTYFEWEEVEGADLYIMNIYYQKAGQRIYAIENATMTTTKVQMSDDYLEENKFYTWEIIAQTEGIRGESSTSKFILIEGGNNQPELLLPEDEATTSNDITFEWGAIEGAENYEHHLFLKTNDSDPLLAGTTDETTTRIQGIEINQHYIWRVRAYFGNSSGDHEYGLWTDFSEFFVDSQSGVQVLAENSNINISPNPARDFLEINTNKVITRLTIYDLNGAKIIGGNYIGNIDISSFAKGTYIIITETPNTTYINKFIKE